MSTADLLTTAQVADIVGASRRMVLRWVEAGKLNPVTQLPGPTGALLFTRSDVEALTQEATT